MRFIHALYKKVNEETFGILQTRETEVFFKCNAV